MKTNIIHRGIFMKNPFQFLYASKGKPIPHTPAPVPQPEPVIEAPAAVKHTEPQDSFVEWCRTRVHGGIERRERSDIFEAYTVYGEDNGALTFRRYHRYPEHERTFGLSESRSLDFEAFNKRLLAELDRGGVGLSDYHACIARAKELTGNPSDGEAPLFEGFSDSELAVLRGFCDSMDILTDREYRVAEGIFRCSCRSAVGDEGLSLWFRKPLPHDALEYAVPGVKREEIYGYDIEDLWTLGVYNRLRERSQAARVTRLTSEWSLNHESLCLIAAEGFSEIDGTLLMAIADEDAFPRFGFYSLDFANK